VGVIAFDGACFGDGPVTGVGRAFLEGLRAYAKDATADCVLLAPAGSRVEPLRRVRQVLSPRGRWRRQQRLPGLLRELGADLLHSSVTSVPLRAPCPTIATAHDLPWLHPESGERAGLWRPFATARALGSAARVLAPSSMTAADARRLLGAAASRVVLVPHGLPPPSAPQPNAELRDGPLLVLGDDRPRKNRARVRAAYERFAEQRPDAPALRFVGPPDDYVTEDEKFALLRRCRAVVHASRFEGFGLPVLEALAHGAPLVCSDLEPHREVAQDAARYVDPNDTASILEGLVDVHEDLKLRAQQAERGPRRAARYSAERTAEAWRRVHADLLR
jgi:hypothetical protein